MSRRLFRWSWRRSRVGRRTAELLDAVDVVDFGGDSLILSIVLAVVLPILIAIVAVVFGELLLVLLVLPVVIVFRALFHRPWTVDVRPVYAADEPGAEPVHSEQVVGWRAAGRRVAELSRTLDDAGVAGLPDR